MQPDAPQEATPPAAEQVEIRVVSVEGKANTVAEVGALARAFNDRVVRRCYREIDRRVAAGNGRVVSLVENRPSHPFEQMAHFLPLSPHGELYWQILYRSAWLHHKLDQREAFKALMTRCLESPDEIPPC